MHREHFKLHKYMMRTVEDKRLGNVKSRCGSRTEMTGDTLGNESDVNSKMQRFQYIRLMKL